MNIVEQIIIVAAAKHVADHFRSMAALRCSDDSSRARHYEVTMPITVYLADRVLDQAGVALADFDGGLYLKTYEERGFSQWITNNGGDCE